MQTALRIFSERPKLAAGAPASSPTAVALSSPASDRPPASSRLAKQIPAGETMADEAAELALPMEKLRVEDTQPEHAMHAPVSPLTTGSLGIPGPSKPPAGSRLAKKSSAGIKAAKEGPLSALATAMPADVQLQQAPDPLSMAASAAQHQTEGKDGALPSARREDAGEEAMRHSKNAAVQSGPLGRASEEGAVPDEAASAPSMEVAVKAVVQQSGSAAPPFGSQQGASKVKSMLDEAISAARMEDPDQAALPNSVNATGQSQFPQGASEEDIVPNKATPAPGTQNAAKAGAQHSGAAVHSVSQGMALQALPDDAVTALLEAAEAAEQHCEIAAVQSGSQEVPSEADAVPDEVTSASRMPDAAEVAAQHAVTAAGKAQSQVRTSEEQAIPNEGASPLHIQNAAVADMQQPDIAAGQVGSQQGAPKEEAVRHDAMLASSMQAAAAKTAVQGFKDAAQMQPESTQLKTHAMELPASPETAAKVIVQPSESTSRLDSHVAEPPVISERATKVMVQPSESALQLDRHVAEPPVISERATKVIVQPCKSASQLGPANNGSDAGKLRTGIGPEAAEAGIGESAALSPSESAQRDSHVAELLVSTGTAAKVRVQPSKNASQLGLAVTDSNAAELNSSTGAEAAEADNDEGATQPHSESAELNSDTEELPNSSGIAAKALVQPSENASQLGVAVTDSMAAELGSSTGAEAAEAGTDEGATQPPSESAQLDSHTEELPISSGTAAVAAAPHFENASKPEAATAHTNAAELGRGTETTALAAVERRAGAPQAQSHLRQLFSRAAELPGSLESAPVAAIGHSEDAEQLEVAKTNSSTMQLGTTIAAVAAAGCRKAAAQTQLDSAQLESNALGPPASPENAADRSRKRNRPIELEKLEEAEKPARGHPAQQGDPNIFSEDVLDTAILATSGAGGLQAIICPFRHQSVQQDVLNQSDQHCDITIPPVVSLFMCRTISAGSRVAEKQID